MIKPVRHGKLEFPPSPVLLLTVLLVLAGCSSYELLSKQPVDENYAVSGIGWTSGENTVVMLKAFKSGNKLALCGAFTGTAFGDAQTQLTRQYFNRASIQIGEEEIGNMAFTNMMPRSALTIRKKADIYVVSESSEMANCVKTKKPWKAEYLRKEITYKGPKVVRGRF